MMKKVCVFAGSNPGVRPQYAEAARELGQAMLQRDLELIYGGGGVGLMGALADSVIGGGGRVVGVIPKPLIEREMAHPRLSELRVVASMHERKAEMARMADAFVALPGGLGTLEELFEIWTWAQLGIHRKPCGLLNASGYYDGLLAFLDRSVGEGFLMPEYRGMMLLAERGEDLLDQLANCPESTVPRWLDEREA